MKCLSLRKHCSELFLVTKQHTGTHTHKEAGTAFYPHAYCTLLCRGVPLPRSAYRRVPTVGVPAPRAAYCAMPTARCLPRGAYRAMPAAECLARSAYRAMPTTECLPRIFTQTYLTILWVSQNCCRVTRRLSDSYLGLPDGLPDCNRGLSECRGCNRGGLDFSENRESDHNWGAAVRIRSGT